MRRLPARATGGAGYGRISRSLKTVDALPGTPQSKCECARGGTNGAALTPIREARARFGITEAVLRLGLAAGIVVISLSPGAAAVDLRRITVDDIKAVSNVSDARISPDVASLAPSIAADLRRMTVDDIMAVRNVTDARISPDGTRVAYVVSVPDLERNLHDSDLWLADMDGGEPLRLTRGPGRDDHARWSPDGSRIAFLSDRSGRTQVWTIDPGGGEAARLTDLPHGAGPFEWSPDGKLLAMLLPEMVDPKAAAPGEPEPVDVIRPDLPPPHTHIHLIDAAAGTARRLTGGEFAVEAFSWSPGGDRIAFSARPTNRVPDLFNTDLHVVEIVSGATRGLVTRPGPDTTPRWSPDGRRIAFISTVGRLEWIANWTICLVSAEGGEPRTLAGAFDEFITSCHWAADGRRLFFQGNRGVTIQLHAVDAETGRVETISKGPRTFTGFSFSADTRRMAFMVSDPRSPDDVHASVVEPFEPVRLSRANPQLESLALGEMEVVHWTAPDGRGIEGLLLKPVGFEAGRRYPLLTYVHGGPSAKFGATFSPQISNPIQGESYPLQAMAGEGYAIFLPNPRGSYGYGEAFRMANLGDWGGGDYNDIMSGIDALIEKGVADPERLGVMGRSYGGYMTGWIITQTDRFKAASLGAGMSNLISFYGQTDIPGFMEYYFGGDCWERRDLYLERSPLTHARKVTTPTLITHGEKDARVPLPQAQELYAALERAGVQVEFVVYPRQGHVYTEPRLQRDQLRRNLEWFRRWLKPGPGTIRRFCPS